jgi:hypothetical protein
MDHQRDDCKEIYVKKDEADQTFQCVDMRLCAGHKIVVEVS